MPSKTVKLGLALLATSALTAATLELGAQRNARSELRRLIAAHPSLSVAGIDASPLRGRVTLFGVKAVSGSTTISIGALHLPLARPAFGFVESAAASPFDDEPPKPETPSAAPEAAPPAPAPAPSPSVAAPTASGTASADNVVITSGTTTFHIKHIDLAGTPLSNADLAALVDPNSTTSVGDRLKKLTAASIVIPEIIGDDVGPGHEQHWTERQILLANVVAGKIAAGSAASMSITTKDPDDVVDATLGAIEMFGVDLPQIVRVFGTKRTDDSEPLVALVDSLSVNGAQLVNSSKKSTISIGPIKETGFKGRALAIDPAEANSADKEKSKQVLDDLVRSFAIGGFQAANFAFSDDKSNDKFTLASLSMRDFGASKVGSLSATDFVFGSDKFKLAIASMDIGTFSIPAASKAGKADANKDLALPLVGKTEFKTISVDARSAGNDPSASPSYYKFDLKRLSFFGDGVAGSAPKQGAMSFENLTFDVPDDSSVKALRDMGYTHLDISGGLKSNYDAAAQTLNVTDFTLSGVDMGKLSLGFDLANVNSALFSSNAAAAKVAALAVLLKGFDLRLENAGIVDKAMAWQAKNDGLTLEQERTKVVASATTDVPASLGNGANAKLIGAAVGKFLGAPKTLHISAASKSGLGVADAALINTPDVLLDSLDVTASAND